MKQINVLTENKNIQNQADYLLNSQNSQNGCAYKQDYSQLFYQFIQKIDISSNKIINFYDDFLIKKLDLAEQHVQQISKLSQLQKPRKRVETNIKQLQQIEQTKEQLQDLKRVKIPFYETSTKKVFDDKYVNNLQKDLLDLDLESIDYFQSSQIRKQSSCQIRQSSEKQRKSKCNLQNLQEKEFMNNQKPFKLQINGQDYKKPASLQYNQNGKNVVEENEKFNKKNNDADQLIQQNKNQIEKINIKQNTSHLDAKKQQQNSPARKSLILQFSEMKVQNKQEIKNDKKQIQNQIEEINIEEFCSNALNYTCLQQQPSISTTTSSNNQLISQSNNLLNSSSHNQLNTSSSNQYNSQNYLSNTFSSIQQNSQNSFKENQQLNERQNIQSYQLFNQQQKLNQYSGSDQQQYFNQSINSQPIYKQQQFSNQQQLQQNSQQLSQQSTQQLQSQSFQQQQNLVNQNEQLFKPFHEVFNNKLNQFSNDQFSQNENYLLENSSISEDDYLKFKSKNEDYDKGIPMQNKQMYQEGFNMNNVILSQDEEEEEINEYEITDYSSNESSNQGSPVFNLVIREEFQNDKMFQNDQNSLSQQNNIYYMNKFNSKNNNIFECSLSQSEEGSKNFNSNPVFNNPMMNNSYQSSQNSFGFVFDKQPIQTQDNIYQTQTQQNAFFSQESFAGKNISNFNQQKDNIFQIEGGNNLLMSLKDNDSNSQQFQYYQNKKLLESPQKLKTVKQRKILYCNNKEVPKWAYDLKQVTQTFREQKVKGENPFNIFGYFAVENLNLRVVFQNTGRRYDEGRGSSANWRKDCTPEQIEHLINATSQTPNKKQKMQSKIKSFLQNSYNSIKKKLIS